MYFVNNIEVYNYLFLLSKTVILTQWINTVPGIIYLHTHIHTNQFSLTTQIYKKKTKKQLTTLIT